MTKILVLMKILVPSGLSIRRSSVKSPDRGRGYGDFMENHDFSSFQPHFRTSSWLFLHILICLLSSLGKSEHIGDKIFDFDENPWSWWSLDSEVICEIDQIGRSREPDPVISWKIMIFHVFNRILEQVPGCFYMFYYVS